MSTAVSTAMFRVGDEVRAKYMSDETIVGVVTDVSGSDVRVAYEWDVLVHYGPALQLLRTVERRFIPDDEFAREVCRTRTPNASTTCESVATVQVRGGVSDSDRMGATVTVWRWEPDSGRADHRPDGRKVFELARNAIWDRRKTRLAKLYVEVFRSEHGAGVASRTVYQVVAR